MNLKKLKEIVWWSFNKKCIFAPTKKGHVAQLNSALDYGSRGCRFESCHGHKNITREKVFKSEFQF